MLKSILNELYYAIPEQYRVYILLIPVALGLFIKFRGLFKSGKTWKIVPKYGFDEIETMFPQGTNRWTNRSKFEDKIAGKYGWFVYIKYDETGKPLVVGKSGTRRFNQKSDISFDLNNQNGPARRYLNSNGLDWDTEHIAIKGTRTEYQAYKLERKILNRFKVYGS